MSEDVFRRYLEAGPDAMTLQETTTALGFRDEHPAEAHRVQARLEAEQREALDRENLRDDRLREGGDPRDFEAAHREISAEAQKERLRQMDEAAREASARAIVGGF